MRSNLARVGIGLLLITGCVMEGATEEDIASDEQDLASHEQAIVGGAVSTANYWGATVSIWAKNDSGVEVHWCGGTLITREWILTAAHCFPDRQPTKVIIGRKDYNDTTIGEEIVFPADQEVMQHPDYSGEPDYLNDIAMIKLPQQSTVNPPPLRIASSTDMTGVAIPGTNAVVVGWGSTDAAGTVYPHVQRGITLPLVAGCPTGTQLCAGNTQGKDSCSADSGGPLMIKVGGEWIHAGIVSYGPFPCADGNPGVYTRTASFVPWINETLNTDRHTVWAMPADGSLTHVSSGVTRPSIQQPLAGDFNGDGKTDVYYYQPGTGKDYMYINGIAAGIELGATLTYEPKVGDFDGNGYDDIFWYSPNTNDDKIWWFYADTTPQGYQYKSATMTGSAVRSGTKWKPIVGDFDKNGKDDIYWYAPGSPADSVDEIWYMSTSPAVGAKQPVFTTRAKPLATTYSATLEGDFNGDGIGDIFFVKFGTTASDDTIWFGSTVQGTFTTRAEDVQLTSVPLAGDFDGNGCTDAYWYRPGATGTIDRVWKFATNGTHTQVDKTVTGYYTPVVGDFVTGSPKTSDILWYRGGRARGEVHANDNP